MLRKVTCQGDYDEVLQTKNKLVVVDFCSNTCGSCTMLKPVVDKIASSYAKPLEIYTVDIDDQPEIATQHDIKAVPTLLFYKDGTEIDRMVGADPHTFKSTLDSII